MNEIMLVIPVTGKGLYEERVKYLEKVGMDVDVSIIEKGSSSIECFYDTSLSVPDTLRKIEEAEKKGYKAVVIDCACDPALQPARERVDIPVLGPGQTSMLTAMSLGGRFSLLTVTKNVVGEYWHNIHAYGLSDNVASIKVIDVPVLDLHEKKDEVMRQLIERSIEAIEKDGASVLIIGCTGMAFLKDELQQRLKNKGYDIPIIDPILTTLNYAQMLIRLGLKQSRIDYMKPPEKERTC